MKKSLILTSLLFICILANLSAETVKEDKARLAAQNWYRHYAPDNKKSASVASVSEYKHNDRTAFYIYNFDQGGFVLVSANNAATPVLGYGFEHSAPEEITNESVKGWFDNYARQIDTAFVLNLKNEEMAAMWQEVLENRISVKNGTTVNPLLTTTWGQGWPYNSMCPSDPAGPGGHVWAGCVATAMAQILKYHNYPDQGLGSYGYQYSNYPYTGANFGATTYNWSNMPNSISTVNNDVATITYHAAVSTLSMWGSASTGVGWYNDQEPMTRAFVNYFRMAYSSLEYVKKVNYTTTDWYNLLDGELLANRPVYYDGDGTSGHAWVCDGVDANAMYHFNWGWDGSYNGYYSLSAINPGGQNFNENQCAIIGIQANDGSTLVSNTTWSGNLNHTSKIAVPDAITLTVNAGSQILFAQGAKLQIYGRLLSIGTATNYVRFSSIDTNNRWHGIKWDNEYNWYDVMADNDSSKLIYTQVEYSGNSGLYTSRFGKILMKNSKISNNNGGHGGGIFVDFNSINIWNSEIYKNHASMWGGGIFIQHTQDGASNICQNDIYDNMAQGGGAIGMSFGNANVIGNIIRNNQAIGGAGIFISQSESPLIQNNILVNNYSIPIEENNGTLYLSYSNAYITGNLIANNNASGIHIRYQSAPTIVNSTIVNNYGLYSSGIIMDNNSDAIIKNCVIYNNQVQDTRYGINVSIRDINSDPVFDHCNIQGGLAGFGGPGAGNNYEAINYTYNVDADPVFVNPSAGAGAGYDGLIADWSLQNISPSVNTGTPAVELPEFDYIGNPRIFGGRVDQGALENQHIIAKPDAVLHPERIYFLTGMGETTTKTSKLFVVNYPDFSIDSISGLDPPFFPVVNQDFEIDIQYSPTLTGLHQDTLQIYCSNGVYNLIVQGESGYCESLPSAVEGNITIICNVIIPENDTLTILPGAKLNFFSNSGLVIRGTLIANGTENDSIIFTASKKGEKWNGIVIEGNESTSSSQISYNNIEHASNSGIEVKGNRKANISRSKISHNTNGLMLTDNADVFVTKSIFEYNGKGLHLMSTQSIIYDNIIRKNSHMTGAGISATWGGAKVLNNMITDNIASNTGGGVYLEDNLPGFVFANNVVANNQVSSSQNDWDCGGGLCIRGNFAGFFFNNTIVNNKANRGAGIAIILSNHKLQNNIIYGNEGAIGSQIYLIDANPVFKNCNILGGTDAFGYLEPIIFNPENFINSFSADPQFVLPSEGAGNAFSGYHALWRLNGQSSSINAGDTTGLLLILPQYALGGGDRLIGNIDIGAYEYCDLNAVANPVIGPIELCEDNIISYTTASVNNLMSHWILPYDWDLLSENGKSSITVKAGMNSGVVKVFPESGCGVGTPSEIAVSSAPLPVISGEFVGPTEVCSLSSHVYWLPQGDNDLFYYDWNFPTDWTILYGHGTNFIAVQIGNESGNVSVTANNRCGQSPIAEKTVNTTAIPTIVGEITGPALACAFDTLFYNVAEGNSSYTYNWQLPTGWEFISGQGTNEINVRCSTTDGIVIVSASNSCGVSAAKELFVDVSVLPDQPSFIAGNQNPCININQLYYVTNIAGISYNWSVPSGWTINSGQGSNMITVSVGNTAGTISVTPSNICGIGPQRQLPINTVNPAPSAATTIDGTAVVCAGSASIYYSTPEIPYADSYNWTLPAGFFGNSTTNSIEVYYSNQALSGNITVTGVNDCGEGEAASLFVQVNPLPEEPPIPIGPDEVDLKIVTETVYKTQLIQNASNYFWELEPYTMGEIVSQGDSAVISWSGQLGTASLKVRGWNSNCEFGPWSEVKSIWVDFSFGIDETGIKGVVVFPNPSEGVFTVKSQVPIESLLLKDAAGKTVLRPKLVDSYQIDVDANTFAKGIYFIEITHLYGKERVKLVLH